jgi:hypothetical protein
MLDPFSLWWAALAHQALQLITGPHGNVAIIAGVLVFLLVLSGGLILERVLIRAPSPLKVDRKSRSPVTKLAF